MKIDRENFVRRYDDQDDLTITDAAGERRQFHGMLSPLSFDEGRCWTRHRLRTCGAAERLLDGGGNTRRFFSDASYTEPRSYLQAIQTSDGVIHWISRRLRYRFKYAWQLAASPTNE